MLLDISPLCLYHNVPMMLAEEKRDRNEFLWAAQCWQSS